MSSNNVHDLSVNLNLNSIDGFLNIILDIISLCDLIYTQRISGNISWKTDITRLWKFSDWGKKQQHKLLHWLPGRHNDGGTISFCTYYVLMAWCSGLFKGKCPPPHCTSPLQPNPPTVKFLVFSLKYLLWVNGCRNKIIRHWKSKWLTK